MMIKPKYLVPDPDDSYPDDRNLNAVLWDHAYGTKENLTWCRTGNPLGPVAVPVPVEGDLDPPFVLVSVQKGDQIILRAVASDDAEEYRVPFLCMHDEEYLNRCRKGALGSISVVYLNASGAKEINEEYNMFDDLEDAILQTFVENY
jgi:hypothetical protein